MNVNPTLPSPQVLGFVVPGGPVRTDFQAADPKRLTLTLNAPGDLPIPLSSVSEIVCFLLPNAPIPPDHGLLIYWQVITVGDDGTPISTGFELLGSLTPQNPSGSFRTNWSHHDQVSNLSPHQPCQVVLGVSMEVLSEIQNLPAESFDSRLFSAQKIATDLFHFMQSFDTGGGIGGNIIVPSNIFDRWIKRFEARYRRDPNFFMKTQD